MFLLFVCVLLSLYRCIDDRNIDGHSGIRNETRGAWVWKQSIYHDKTFGRDANATLLRSFNMMTPIARIVDKDGVNRPTYLSISVWETQIRSPVPRPMACAALCSLTVRDVKPAWRSRWLRHRSLRCFDLFSASACLLFVFLCGSSQS